MWTVNNEVLKDTVPQMLTAVEEKVESAAEDKTQRECVFVCERVYRGRRGWMREMKRKSAPRMQDMEAPTERRVLIGCLETTASGRGISMHEICCQEREKRGRDHSNITKSWWDCPPYFDFHYPCCTYINLKLIKLDFGMVNYVEDQEFG